MSASIAGLGLGRTGLPRAVLELCTRLRRGGHRSWIVGGCVRDSLLSQLEGRTGAGSWVAKDWDIATDALPEQVTRLFRRVIPTGIEHGTVTVILEDVSLEVTTLRADKGYADGRRPDQIDFVASIDEDLARRDFTVNAIAFEPETESIVDPFDGRSDLVRRRLRAVGVAAQRFGEDGLRVLRAARFVAALEFELDPDTALAMRPSLDTYRRVSAERIRDEWQKTLRARAPSLGFRVMLEHGLLDITAPELAALGSQSTSAGDLFTVSLRRVDQLETHAEKRLTALLTNLDGEPSRAAEMADALLARLRYSNAERKWVTRLIRERNVPATEALPDAEVRRWLVRVGTDLYRDLCSVARADVLARHVDSVENGRSSREQKLAALARFEARATEILAANPPLSISALAIDGKALMADAGFKPGREIGRALESLLDLVLEDPSQNTKERLLERARSLTPQS